MRAMGCDVNQPAQTAVKPAILAATAKAGELQGPNIQQLAKWDRNRERGPNLQTLTPDRLVCQLVELGVVARLPAAPVSSLGLMLGGYLQGVGWGAVTGVG